MKKVIFALAAVVALAACSKEQTVVADRGDAIGFDSFIENATRAAADDFTTVSSFKVWGDVTGNIDDSNDDYIFLYDGASVTKGGNAYGAAWTCEKTEYWLPSATYNFMAIAGISGETTVTPASGAFPTAINYTADGATDLLLSEYVTVKTDNKSNPTGVNDKGCVAFTFKHLLSKVYFNFVNNSTSDNYKFEIGNITISGAKASGEYSITDKKWTSVSDDAVETPFSFGSVANTIEKGASAPSPSANACLFIPGAQTLTVRFTQKTYSGDKPMGEDTITAPLSTSFDANGCYIIKVSLSAGKPISFTVEQDGLSGWDNKTDISIP
jgi:hypothetical protein